MIELVISKTYKGYSPKDHWTRYDDVRKSFSDMAAAKKWIGEEYGKRKRSSMYIDLPEGKTMRSGWVISGRSSQYENDGTVSHFFTQDWIGVKESHYVDPNRRK